MENTKSFFRPSFHDTRYLEVQIDNDYGVVSLQIPHILVERLGVFQEILPEIIAGKFNKQMSSN